MAVQDWNTTPSANTSIDGTFIGEGCPPGNVNGAIRAVMASVRVMYNNLPSGGNYAPVNSPGFTGQPYIQGRGAMLWFGSSALSSGVVHVQQQGQNVPGMQNGDMLIEFA